MRFFLLWVEFSRFVSDRRRNIFSSMATKNGQNIKTLPAETDRQRHKALFFFEIRNFILRYYAYASTRHFPSRNFVKFARSSAEEKQDIGKTYAMALLI